MPIDKFMPSISATSALVSAFSEVFVLPPMCADERRHGCASSYPDSFRVWWTDSCSLTDKLFSCEGCRASHTALPQILDNLSGSPDACAAVGLLYSLHFLLAVYIHWTKSTRKKMQTPTNLPAVITSLIRFHFSILTLARKLNLVVF